LPLLGQRPTRGPAREAFLAYGERGLVFLDQALRDRSLPQELRRHLPRTLSLFSPVEAARCLEKHLPTETDGMVRFKILRALNQVGLHPEVQLDRSILRQAIESTMEAGLRLLDWRHTFLLGAEAEPRRRTPGHELLVTLLQDKEVHTVERVFRLLSLRFRSEDMKGIYRGLASTNPKVRASGRELLENLLEPPLREGVLALIDDGPPGERLRRAASFYAAPPLDYESLLGRILEESSESLRCVAAYHVGELGLARFRPRLESMRSTSTGFFLTRVVERALALLAAGGGTLLHA
jgi:AAA family ATP:ADP antiporter